MNDTYMFSDHDDAPERRRLQMLEQVHDPRTIDLLGRAGLRSGQNCAEIGAGAGSIAQHMTGVVGRAGSVVAVDIDPRFLAPGAAGRVEVRQADITKPGSLERQTYDIIHARFLLVHLQDPVSAVLNMVAALKPGGALVLEEPDFRTAFSASADLPEKTSVDAVNRAICSLYAGMGKDPGFGLRLPGIVLGAGLRETLVEVVAPLVPGGDRLAVMMGSSVSHLRDRLIDTGAATAEDVDRYRAASTNAAAWASYYATVSVIGRR
jgi:SAM-dependent methyltransferase